ncbi:MAG: TIGR03905 family TSCPD domain-containing protein [Clostridiales bacterium]|nr:TIGR03905 family TSCPD domain-containing protein [Clostridiales bacterium]
MVYKTSGVCSSEINFEIDEKKNTVKAVNFKGGCSGNANGISRLVVGMPVDEVIKRLEGVSCGFKSTSCPDQLAKALKKWRSDE